MDRVTDQETKIRFCEMLSQAFAVPLPAWELWSSRIGTENLRYVEEDGAIICGLGFYPFAHYWHGKPVSAAGVAGVGTVPHRRGFGHVKRLLMDTLRECRERGMATASLYPADWPIYRACGFELAGSHYQFRAEINVFSHARQSKSLDLHPVSPAQRDEIRNIYAGAARHSHGWLQRNEAIWERIEKTYGDGKLTDNFCYLIGKGDGYFIYSQSFNNGEQELTIQDYVLSTPLAAQQLQTFLAYHSSIFKRVFWKGDPQGGFFQQNFYKQSDISKREIWMLRILDVEKALTERGYSPVIDLAVAIAVEDPDLPENTANYVLTVKDGKGCVEKTRQAGVTTDVRTLASLYTGFITAQDARRQGRLNASDKDCAVLDAMFASQSPWCPDYF